MPASEPVPPRDAAELFLDAAAIGAAGERAAFLDRACGGDGKLRAEVESLLEADALAGAFLRSPAAGGPGASEGRRASDATGAAGDDRTVLGSATAAAHVGAAGEPAAPIRLGAYDIEAPIGRGGMGVVLRARDRHLHRTVAIKTLAPELAADATARQRFAREARAAAAVSHPHVVAIHAVEPDGPTPFLVMEYVAGRSLKEKLAAEGALDLPQILRIGSQIARGLAAAHEQGLIHRDVKPANVLLENGVERVKLTDFGLARAADDAAITRTGEIAGTPQYMSPEQAEGKPVDFRSDLFSLGCVLYAMGAGRPPFRGNSAVAVLRKVCDATPRPIRELNPDLPPWLATAIDRLLEKDPARRPESAARVAAVLGRRLALLQSRGRDANDGGEDAVDGRGDGTELIDRLADQFDRGRRRATPARRPVARWAAPAAAALVAVLLGGGVSEATGLTDVTGTVVRLVRGEGTLVVRTDDPNVGVTVEGDDVVLTGTGLSEVRLKPGAYTVRATKHGEPDFSELVLVERNGREVVHVGWEPTAPTPAAPTAADAAPAAPAGTPLLTAAPPREADWITIFDGHSPDGWHTDPPAVWSVEPGGGSDTDAAGALLATLPPGVRLAELRWGDRDGTERRLPADFEVSFEFAASPGTHLKVRTRDRDGSLFAEFAHPPGNEWWGMLTSRVPSREQVYYRLNGARPPGLGQSAAAAAESAGGREWHRVRLRVEGRTASMAVNGVEFGGGTDPDLFAGPEGLRFEVYRTSRGGEDATVRLRHVRYRPLRAGGSPELYAERIETGDIAPPREERPTGGGAGWTDLLPRVDRGGGRGFRRLGDGRRGTAARGEPRRAVRPGTALRTAGGVRRRVRVHPPHRLGGRLAGAVAGRGFVRIRVRPRKPEVRPLADRRGGCLHRSPGPRAGERPPLPRPRGGAGGVSHRLSGRGEADRGRHGGEDARPVVGDRAAARRAAGADGVQGRPRRSTGSPSAT